MRDPERITDVLAELRTYWDRYPDLRLGQLVSNMVAVGHDIYQLEDDVLLGRLHRANAEGRPLSVADLDGVVPDPE